MKENSAFKASSALKSFVEQIKKPQLVEPCKDRCSVTVILRYTGDITKNDYLLQNWNKFDEGGQLEILFLRRVFRYTDNWSGHICFPGGHQNPNETDFETAVRETEEEINLNLIHEDVLYLGRLRDFIIYSWNQKPDMSVSSFVFLLLNPSHSEIKVNPKEIADYYWVPISYFFDRPDVSNKPFENTSGVLSYPMVYLYHDSNTRNDEEGGELWGITLRIACEMYNLMGYQFFIRGFNPKL